MSRLGIACAVLGIALATCASPTAPNGPVAASSTTPSAGLPSASAIRSAEPPAPAAGSALAVPSARRPPYTGPAPQIRGGGARVVQSQRGLVVAVEAEAARIGAAILGRGGNAVDAAVAVAFALAVTHPSAGNIGGGGFMLVKPKGGKTVAVDFREVAPRALTRERFDAMSSADGIGPASVGVPGTVQGLSLAHARFGKLAFAELVRPAVKLARDGHRVGPREAQTISWSWRALEQDPAAKAELGQAGKPAKVGTKLTRPELARTLERIATDGPKGFYEGETSRAIAQHLSGHGGLIAEDDLRAYRAQIREPIAFSYRGLEVEVMPPPSAGGVAVLQTLGLLEALRAWELEPGSAPELHLFLEASRRAQIDKRFAVIDPDAWSPDQRAAELSRLRDIDRLLAVKPIDRDRATPSADLHPLFGAAMRELEHTTHFAVVDADGMAVSCTTTLSAGFGAKLVVPGTGIVLNNAVASFATSGENLPTPGRRTTSSMSPTLVSRDGELLLVLGSPGGDTIPSTVVQVLRHLVDHGMTLDQAVDAPRLHHGFVPDELRFEKARPVPKPILRQLEALGHRVSKKTQPMGDANSIVLLGGVAYGYADPREGGVAVAPRVSPRR